MKKLILAFVLILAASAAQAQTITCTASGFSTRQTAQYAKWLASLNAQRATQTPPLPAYANFAAHCSAFSTSAFLSFVAEQDKLDSAKVADQAILHGDETALPGHCSAAGLAAGCTKAQVSCFVLTGNTLCQ